MSRIADAGTKSRFRDLKVFDLIREDFCVTEKPTEGDHPLDTTQRIDSWRHRPVTRLSPSGDPR